ncbi:hypothetical protein FIBSPDRAFT_733502 [Athelia psychrophila]|uniref:CxC6 like cysteine cluster associated with KDZ domain-containing protein n=1 Tax=Athelia psychrophila TaxID=1759441 RepID=A0A166P3I3_9AGAM|nr:hypothetical protein FIBSPDRAFT_733502 [Fibularhizoctonia sp. CBS 109695]
MALLKDITDALIHYPDLYSSVPFLQIDRFVRVTRRLKHELQIISPATVDSATPPHRLPQYVHEFLREHGPNEELTPDDIALFQLYGNPANARKQEQLGERYPVVFHSAAHGPSPALTSSLGCTKCSMRYYHNYYVQRGLRFYYHAPSGFKAPGVIQVEEHVFIEAKLCEHFTLSMLFACPHPGPQKLSISTVEVWHSFNLNALLRDCADRNVRLVLSDVGSQDERLQHAMEERNQRISTDGQRERMHACDRCEKLIPGSGYYNLRPLRAVVIDGLSMGHPCCKMHNCTHPLVTNRHHYCHHHQSEATRCAVVDCDLCIDRGFSTCSKPEHRALEIQRKERGQAFFQLQQRLKRASIGQVLNSFADRTILDDDDVDNPADYSTSTDVPKSDEGNRKPKARLGRRRTHNEQLIVCCCGVIAARTTMFGAEAISGVKDFIKHTYRHNSDNLPDVIFFDNNCRLQAHLNKQKDTFFRRVILAVDVFHFKSKHKESDVFCQKHCNPALWKELYDEDGSWVFNSSAAEQANVWMGGYLCMTREMLQHRYNFFLDEVIKRRNEKQVHKLKDAGLAPYHINDVN